MVYTSGVSVTSEVKLATPFASKSPQSSCVCVASPGELATKGVQAPRDAMQEWMLACGIVLVFFAASVGV